MTYFYYVGMTDRTRSGWQRNEIQDDASCPRTLKDGLNSLSYYRRVERAASADEHDLCDSLDECEGVQEHVRTYTLGRLPRTGDLKMEWLAY